MPTASREQAYPEALRSKEDRLVAERRARVDATVVLDAAGGAASDAGRPAGPTGREARDERPRVGLALSGGGIRSATFSLGVLQALARQGLVGRVDFLSTVSGGGYVGAFLGCLFQRWRGLRAAARPSAAAEATTPAAAVRELLVDPKSWPCHWLRECGRYLIPNRGSDEAVMLAAFLRNWLAVQSVLAVVLLGPLTVYRLAHVLAEGAAPGLPPAALFVAALVALWLVPAGLAYWLSGPFVVLLAGLAAAAAGGAYAGWAGALALPPRAAAALAALAGTILLTLLVGAYYARRYADLAERRRYLTAGLAMGLQSTAVVLAFAAIDGLGGFLRDLLRDGAPILTASGLLGALGAVAAFVQKIAPRLLEGRAKPGRLQIPGQLVAFAAALAIVGAECALLSALLHGAGARTLALGLVAVAVACALLGQTESFLNLSTQSTIYAARLTRAYLGATNAVRQRYHKPLSDPLEGDDVAFRAYEPWTEGGPLHVVNVTLNETMSGETQVEFRDRKGLNVAFGPCGMSVGARHHAQFAGGAGTAPDSTLSPETPGGRGRFVLERVSPPEPFQVFVPDRAAAEPFPLGRLVAISGAAFTTGLGSRTSVGMSLLLGLANVRLGYWWNSGTGPRAGRAGAWRILGRLFPVQAHLVEEMLARFYGPAERLWYLSDGGHFENTAVYELVRRRLPFIVACDNGCDPAYAWADVGNLVRKLRLDFGAQVRFLEPAEIAAAVDPALQGVIVPWSTFAAWDGATRGRGGYATLAEVTYEDTTERTTILFLKPALRGDETADVLTYWSRHPEFPQQSTLDQFFDEDQWESYRRLGDACGTAVFRAGLGEGWSPASMAPIPPAREEARARSVTLVDAPPTA